MRVADYRDIEILPNSIVYCDIPYIGTKGYRTQKFDHDAFYQWAREQESLVFISEYSMPDDFVPIFAIERRSSYSATNNGLVCTEKVFIHQSKVELYQSLTQRLPI